MRRALALGAVLVLLAGAAAPGAQGSTFDRTLVIVGGKVILASDVELARQLKLVAAADDSDAAILAALENRVLVLAEVSRALPPEPSSDELAARRRQWEQSLGPGVDVAARLAAAHMSEPALRAWLLDDLRIQKYEDQRFGRQADPAAARAAWIADLRHRAGLPAAPPQPLKNTSRI